MRQRLLEFVALLVACASIFALVFALLGSASVFLFLILSLGEGLRPEQEFFTRLFILIYAVPAACIGGFAGAITGALYMMAPRRARDAWMAMAIGAGVVLVALLLDPGGLDWPFLWIAGTAGPVIFAALASLASAWIIRKLSILG